MSLPAALGLFVTPPPPAPCRARPGRRRGVRWARGTASTRRSRARSRGRTRPRRGRRRARRRCPTLSFGRVLRPRSTPIRISSPTPSRSMETNGSLGRIAARHVGAEKARGVVAADAEGGLGQIVGAEGKELRGLGDLGGAQRRPRQLDHGADLIVDSRSGLARDRLRHGVDARLDQVELGLGGDERDHHLGHHRLARALCRLDRGLEDGARLHLGDLGIGDARADSRGSRASG